MTAAMRNKPPSTRHPPRAICHPPADQTHTRTHNNANEITAITRSPGDLPDPLHGPAGCNVYGPKPNDDANGMHSRYDLPTPDGLRQAGAWNLPDRQAGRLATVHWDANSNGTLDANDTLRATYRYDGLNRRVRKVVVGDDANTTTEHAYHNTAWQVLEIRRGLDGAAPAATASAYKEYAWDLRYIDAPICRWWDADTDGQMKPTAGEQHYYTNDAQFNATALIDANSGSVVERYMYDPYGKPTFLDANWPPIPASAHENEILYCGYRHDPETGLYQVRNRYLNWLLGRWVTWDKSGYVDGASLYEYVRSSPLLGVDPLGLQTAIRQLSTDHPPSTYDNRPYGIPSRPGNQKQDAREEARLKLMEKQETKKYREAINNIKGASDADREALIRKIFAPKPAGDPFCKDICPCPATEAKLDKSWIPDPWWVGPWLHPGAVRSYKHRMAGKEKGNQCTYDSEGKLITHGPAAGTPDKIGGHRFWKHLAHFKKDVKYLERNMHKYADYDLRYYAIMEKAGFDNEVENYDRQMAAIHGWKHILYYQANPFYRPCVVAGAKENWGPWEFDSDGWLVYKGAIPDEPIAVKVPIEKIDEFINQDNGSILDQIEEAFTGMSADWCPFAQDSIDGVLCRWATLANWAVLVLAFPPLPRTQLLNWRCFLVREGQGKQRAYEKVSLSY